MTIFERVHWTPTHPPTHPPCSQPVQNPKTRDDRPRKTQDPPPVTPPRHTQSLRRSRACEPAAPFVSGERGFDARHRWIDGLMKFLFLVPGPRRLGSFLWTPLTKVFSVQSPQSPWSYDQQLELHPLSMTMFRIPHSVPVGRFASARARARGGRAVEPGRTTKWVTPRLTDQRGSLDLSPFAFRPSI